LKTIARQVLRQLERGVPEGDPDRRWISIARRVLEQKKHDIATDRAGAMTSLVIPGFPKNERLRLRQTQSPSPLPPSRRHRTAHRPPQKRGYFIPFWSDTPKLASALFRGSLNSYS